MKPLTLTRLAVAIVGLSCGACGSAGSSSAAAPADAAQRTTEAPRSSLLGGLEAVEIEAEYATERLPNDPDDPAIWIHPGDPGRSLILGTVKVAAPAGGLAVFGLDGVRRQLITGIDRPNNVDVEYGLTLGGRKVDLAVVTERLRRQLRVFSIPADGGSLVDLGGIPILEGAEGEQGAPMGIALYKRPRDGAVFAIVSPKEGPRTNYLWQYRLSGDSGGMRAELVRRFGTFSGPTAAREDNEIESVAVDDELGFVYYADEGNGIHKWHADPDHPAAASELAHFGQDGFAGDREGIALYTLPAGAGYIVCTDQVDDDTRYFVYQRGGEPGRPHDHRLVAVLKGGADSTDGIEISSHPFGPGLPSGIFVAMNSTPQNFLVFRWQDVAAAVTPPLRTSAARIGTTD
jgi:3-phytase